jgi:hypothetical protein
MHRTKDSQGQDIALVVENSSVEMLDYLRLLVAIEKGIREPNIDFWATSVEDKLSKIGIKIPRDVVQTSSLSMDLYKSMVEVCFTTKRST